MNLLTIFLITFSVVLSVTSADKCSICKASVKDIKNRKGLAYMAELSKEQIESYVKKNVEKNCSGSICSKLIKDLIDIADQLDDDLDSTPEQLCKFQYYC